MRFSILGIWLLALPVFAAETSVSLNNDREGTTFYSSNSHKRALKRALVQVDGTYIKDAFEDSLKDVDENKLCSFDLVESIDKKLKAINPKFKEIEGAIYHLRSIDEIDDMVAKILLSVLEINTTFIKSKSYDQLTYPGDPTVTSRSLLVIGEFEKRFSKNACFDEAYRNLYGEILKNDKNLKSYHVEALLIEAAQKNLISDETYRKLERARLNGLEENSSSLKSYYKKIKSLRLQYPLRDPLERSNFVTEQSGKFKISHRQRLLENYTDLQIILMANVIKKLRARLESPKAEILIYDRQNGVETITLEPMERFRLAIKLLRKEISHLALNTYFAGRSPDYLDLMTASYEVGIIPASELEEVAGLQDIWNPKKTFWEKASVWVRTLSSVATIVIPPPYGFIPALALVVIEMTAGKKDNQNDENPTDLF